MVTDETGGGAAGLWDYRGRSHPLTDCAAAFNRCAQIEHTVVSEAAGIGIGLARIAGLRAGGQGFSDARACQAFVVVQATASTPASDVRCIMRPELRS